MRVAEAVRLAVSEFADPACGRCNGYGYRGELREDSLCRCVAGRVPHDVARNDGGAGGLPHPWSVITRRAQQIHAANVLEHVPDTWG